MKKILLLLVVMSFAWKANSQIIGDYYIFKKSTLLKECDAEGNPVSGATDISIPSGKKYKIENIDIGNDKKIVISIVKWHVDTKDGKLTDAAISSPNHANNEKYRGAQGDLPSKLFLISASDFTKSEKSEKRARWNFATGSTILKYRPGSSTIAPEIGNNVNISALGAWSFDVNKENTMHFLFGAGVGTVKLTPSTTKKFLTEDSDVAAISPTIGLVHEFIGRGQIGVMFGYDLLSGKAYRQWDYRSRPWIGIGLGFNLFKISSTANVENKDQ